MKRRAEIGKAKGYTSKQSEKRRGILNFRVVEGYCHFTLNYSLRLIEHLYKARIRELLNHIGTQYGYESTWNKDLKVWITHREVATRFRNDKKWLEQFGVEVIG